MGRGIGRQVESLSGNIILLVASTTSTNFVLQPSDSNWGSRLNSLADSFQLYRFTHLRLRWIEGASNTVVSVSMGTTDTFPTSNVLNSQFEYSELNSASQTTPTVLVVPRSYLLASPISWYKSVPGTPTSDFEIQGNIFFTCGSAQSSNIWVSYTIEFTDWAPTTSTPMPKGFFDKVVCPGCGGFFTKHRCLGQGDLRVPAVKTTDSVLCSPASMSVTSADDVIPSATPGSINSGDQDPVKKELPASAAVGCCISATTGSAPCVSCKHGCCVKPLVN